MGHVAWIKPWLVTIQLFVLDCLPTRNHQIFLVKLVQVLL